ncbi:MAG TPA: type I DNA topoisomerase [candidate division Zixibacteria bacterium]|nr:type I DNA topoisomerase [candidate division Zixibacteria bacterium]
MQKFLVIVESPTKSKTLKKFLGEAYDIVASGGHLRDLPADRLGVDIDSGFMPEYIQIPGKSKSINSLKKLAKAADMVYLASDPDREGEAIAWHIAQLLGKPPEKLGRVRFNEITKKAVLAGIANPTNIDINKVDAQQARRILDRLVGYLVSPFLWRTLYKGLSAGRVQSVALRMIVERERAIENFVPEEYWHLFADVNVEAGDFRLKAAKVKGKALKISDKKSAIEHKNILTQQAFSVVDVQQKEVSKSPPPPFITSSMQLTAARQIGFSAFKTMLVAQQLYEGVSLGDEGPSGLITYMRTDSTRISDDAKKSCAAYITDIFGKNFLKIRDYKSGKLSQDAHEAIRPTDVFVTPESVAAYLTKDQYRLYELIWKRFVASLMADAKYNQIKCIVEAGDYELSATDTRLAFEGFLKLTGIDKENGDDDSVTLPYLSAGDKLDLVQTEATQHFTKPPPRFTEGTLVREMEQNGVGRPSTYAQIITTIVQRKYVSKTKGKLSPTVLGVHVFDILEKLFPGLFEVDFTAKMEKDLDKVEDGELRWRELLEEFYTSFEPMLGEANKKRSRIKKELEEETRHVCEKCDNPMIIKWGRHGKFLACSNFPECKNTKPINEDGDPVPETTVERNCPKCGQPLLVKHDRRGHRFLACSAYPNCRHTEPFDTGFACPKTDCNGHLVEKHSRKNKLFFGCSEYPECDFASWDAPTEGKCPSCGCETIFLQVRKRGTIKKCAICGYSEPVDEHAKTE